MNEEGTEERQEEALGEPQEYEIRLYGIGRFFIAGFILLIWSLILYSTLFYPKDGLFDTIDAYCVIAIVTLTFRGNIGELLPRRYWVSGETITETTPYGRTRTYHIGDITRVVWMVRRGNHGEKTYRVYIGKKKIFKIFTEMTNCDRLIAELESRGIPVKEW